MGGDWEQNVKRSTTKIMEPLRVNSRTHNNLGACGWLPVDSRGGHRGTRWHSNSKRKRQGQSSPNIPYHKHAANMQYSHLNAALSRSPFWRSSPTAVGLATETHHGVNVAARGTTVPITARCKWMVGRAQCAQVAVHTAAVTAAAARTHSTAAALGSVWGAGTASEARTDWPSTAPRQYSACCCCSQWFAATAASHRSGTASGQSCLSGSSSTSSSTE